MVKKGTRFAVLTMSQNVSFFFQHLRKNVQFGVLGLETDYLTDVGNKGEPRPNFFKKSAVISQNVVRSRILKNFP